MPPIGSDSISGIENLSSHADLQPAWMALALDAISTSRLETLVVSAGTVICESLNIALLAIIVGDPARPKRIARTLIGWSDELVGDQALLSEAFAAWCKAREEGNALPRVLDLAKGPSDLLTELFVRQGIQSGLVAVVPDGSGIVGLIGVYSASPRDFSDTERRFLTSVAEILASVHERERRESRARRAQTLASLSRMAGGIAHELNNILTIVRGNAQLLELKGDPLDEVAAISRDIQIAMQRGDDLGAYLLAFSRPLPEATSAVDLRDLLVGMTKLWNHVAGSAMDFRIGEADTLWDVRADPGQIIAALIGLAAHVHDVMPGKGCLRFDAYNRHLNPVDGSILITLEPGDYVILDITDFTGSIDPEVAVEAFAPLCAARRAAQKVPAIDISGSKMRVYFPAAVSADTNRTSRR